MSSTPPRRIAGLRRLSDTKPTPIFTKIDFEKRVFPDFGEGSGENSSKRTQSVLETGSGKPNSAKKHAQSEMDMSGKLPQKSKGCIKIVIVNIY